MNTFLYEQEKDLSNRDIADLKFEQGRRTIHRIFKARMANLMEIENSGGIQLQSTD